MPSTPPASTKQPGRLPASNKKRGVYRAREEAPSLARRPHTSAPGKSRISLLFGAACRRNQIQVCGLFSKAGGVKSKLSSSAPAFTPASGPRHRRSSKLTIGWRPEWLGRKLRITREMGRASAPSCCPSSPPRPLHCQCLLHLFRPQRRSNAPWVTVCVLLA